ncbi:MAG: glycosyltransferase family 2 protein [Lachnospiraceae bacterium]|nr:glycosyltransferase family 2 protein [Lachnospiraceae bacterium]
MTVDAVIPTYMPGREFCVLLERLRQQSISLNMVYVVNTCREGWDSLVSIKDNEDIINDIKVEHIAKDEFDHAGVRNRMIGASDADYVLVCTMDAIPADRHLIENLLKPFKEGKVAVSYARQLPKKGANPVERLSRQFNYPDRSLIKSAEDVKKLGIKTYFCSDVCAMYDRRVFKELGGFIEPAIFNEDMVYAHTAVNAGYRVAYCADACVFHSHSYSGLMQLRRNFDNGVSQALHPEVFSKVSSEKEGIKMIKESMRTLLRGGHLIWIPVLIWQSGCKYIGFFLGKRFKKLPGVLVRRISANGSFWKRYNAIRQGG